MKMVEVNREIAEKIYSEVDKFIAGKVRKIDAIAALSALVIQQCLDSEMPKELFLDRISKIWDATERENQLE